MAKDTGRMNIRIDGDNRGFKESLKDSQRSVKQFEQQTSGSVKDLLAAGSILAGGVGTRKFLLGNSAAQLGITGKRQSHASGNGYGVQSMLGAALGNPNLRRWETTHKKRLAKQKARIAKNQSLQETQSFDPNWDGTKRGKATFRAKRQSEKYLQGLQIAANLRLAMPMLAPVVATAAAGAAVAVANQNKFDGKAAEFSGAVIAGKARIEVEELQRALTRSQDSGLVGSQMRSARASQALGRAGTSTSGVNVFSEFASVIKRATAGAVNVVGSAMTAEGAFAAYGGMGIPGGAAYFTKQFVDGAAGRGVN